MKIDRTRVQDRAERLVKQGKIPAAIVEFRLLLKDQPNDINTLNRAGDLLVRIGDNEEAIELFDRVAHLYTLGGFFHKAIAIYRKILKLDPAVIEPRLRLADLYARRDLTTEARAEYMAVAERFLELNEEGRAREVHEKLVRMEPANLAARTVLADIHLRRGEADHAVGELRAAARDLEVLGLSEESRAVHARILGLEGVELEALADSVRALARLGAAPEAVQKGEALRGKFPDDAGAAEALVEALELAGRSGDAEELVKSALGGEVTGAIPRIVLGRLHERAGRRELAVAALLEAAQELWRSKRPADAARALDLLIGLDPSVREALQLRLEVARALDDSEGVAVASERLISDFGEVPGDPVVHDVPPHEASAPADPAMAVELGRALTREEKDFLSEHMTEAEVFIKYGLYEKAIEPLQLVLSRFPAHLEAHSRLKGIFAEQGNRGRVLSECLAIAELHERADRREEAIKALTEAKSLDPDSAVIRGRLERLQGSTKRTPRAVTEPRAPVRPGEMEISVDLEEAQGPGANGSPPGPAAIEAGAGGLLETDGDLSEALHAILDQETVDLGKAPEPEGLGEVLREFREKVAQEVSSSDYRTHYELGIAYKEMGLIDEAIAELENASADRAHFVECCAMLALCYRQKELPAKACDWYVKAIRSELGTADQRIGLEFELAEACLEMGDIARAREAFRRVAGVDRNYRNVTARLVELERMA